MTLDIVELLVFALGMLISILAYLLRQKDEEQAAAIKDLYEKHTVDADRLHYVELKIAADHYVKAELDGKFDKVEKTLISGFESLGNKFDMLSMNLTAHIISTTQRKDDTVD